MICPNCNTHIHEKPRFCPNCGYSLMASNFESMDDIRSRPYNQQQMPYQQPPQQQQAIQMQHQPHLNQHTQQQQRPLYYQQQPQAQPQQGNPNAAFGIMTGTARQQVIKVLPNWMFDSEGNVGKKSEDSRILYKIGLLSITIVLAFICLFLFLSGHFASGMILVTWLAFVGFYAYQYSTEYSDYVPAKSFYSFRLKARDLQMVFIIIMVYLVLVLIAAFSASRGIAFWINIIGFGLTLISVYQSYNALGVHGNVDYETNEFLVSALGVDVNENVLASTQTFDETQNIVDDGDKLIVVTQRQIYFSFYKNGRWNKCVEYISNLNSIGLKHTSLNGSIQMCLIFNDGTIVSIELDVTNKLTSTPSLFVLQFLETVDDHLLGRVREFKQKRSRKVVNPGFTPITPPTAHPQQTNNSILSGISQSTQVYGRKLDL